MAIKINPQQSRKINALIKRLCCNCVNDNCLLLDDGEEHTCVQLISKYSIYCNCFLSSVLPADKELFVDVMKTHNEKHGQICGKALVPKSKNQRYCTECAKVQKRKKVAERQRKKRASLSRF